jgi:hypothetical protein
MASRFLCTVYRAAADWLVSLACAESVPATACRYAGCCLPRCSVSDGNSPNWSL